MAPGERNGKPLQYFCLENPMSSMKRQKDMILKDELPRSVGAQYATGDQWTTNSRRNEEMEQKQNNTQLWMWLVMEAKSGDVKSEIASVQFSSVQLLSQVRLFATPWIAARQASLSITNSWNSLRLTSIESVMPSSHLILCCPLLLLPPVPPSIRVFSSESTLRMRWPKYWSFSFGVSPSKEHPGLISFRMDWLDLLAVQGTLKSLL